MSKVFAVGIDVSAKELVVALRSRDGSVRVSRFKNDASGHQGICRVLGQASILARRSRIFVPIVGVAVATFFERRKIEVDYSVDPTRPFLNSLTFRTELLHLF